MEVAAVEAGNMAARIILYIAVVFALVFGYVKYLEKKGIYYPTNDIEVGPELINLGFEEVNIETKDNVRINGWFIPCKQARYTVLFFHGNAGNISFRIDKAGLLDNAGLSIFIIDYRGYGKSLGIPSEKGLYLDARAAYDYLVNKRNIRPDTIILYGESLGSAVAVDLAAEKKVGGIIIEEGFSCGKDMGKVFYPYFPRFIFSNIFDSLAKIKKVNCPKLFFHSRDDEIIPIRIALKLYNAAGEPKRMVELAGDHNNAFLDSQEVYLSSIISFIKELKRED